MKLERNEALASEMKTYCAEIGRDPLLVQGAGGNVSWKEGDVLWVKASGTWLAHASEQEIFIPVALPALQDAIANREFSAKATVSSDANHRPSIETMLHALMRHKIVVHLHAIEILALLVMADAEKRLKDRMGTSGNWVFVDYHKPGADLAEAIDHALQKTPDAEIIFLKNHGVVFGGYNIDQIHRLVTETCDLLKQDRPDIPDTAAPDPEDAVLAKFGYVSCQDARIHRLSRDPKQFKRLTEDWALYPDHVVFLGAEPAVWSPELQVTLNSGSVRSLPPYIFVPQKGTFELHDATPAQRLQILCYCDVISRIPDECNLSTLSENDIAVLLDWDAEKFRQSKS